MNKKLITIKIEGEDRSLYTGFYRHFKDKIYYVHDIVEHTETGETMVYYEAMYGERKRYVRELSMFLSLVDRDKYPDVKYKYRFTKEIPAYGEDNSIYIKVLHTDGTCDKIVKKDDKFFIERVK